MYTTLLTSLENGILTVTINRPDKMNALNRDVMSDIGAADNIMHCTIKVGDSQIMMCDDPRPDVATASGNISLAIGMNDPGKAKQLFDNLAKGGTVVMPLEKTFWAEAFGMVTDKFGVKWMVNSEAASQ